MITRGASETVASAVKRDVAAKVLAQRRLRELAQRSPAPKTPAGRRSVKAKPQKRVVAAAKSKAKTPQPAKAMAKTTPDKAPAKKPVKKTPPPAKEASSSSAAVLLQVAATIPAQIRTLVTGKSAPHEDSSEEEEDEEEGVAEPAAEKPLAARSASRPARYLS